MHTISKCIVSILTFLIFLASCRKQLKAPEPQSLETGVLSASKSEVALDAANTDKEAVTFSLATEKNSLIYYSLILTSGGHSDTVAIAQNTVSRIFTNSELNTILVDQFGLIPGITADVTAQVQASIPLNGKTAASNVVTIKVTPYFSAPNLVQGGKFDAGDESKWTVLNLSAGVDVSFTNGTALWTGGSWGHAGIYQAIAVEANKKYQVNMNVSGSGASDTWFEVYVGQVVPQQGQDYNDGGMRLGLNTWLGCGKDGFNGQLTTLSCNGTGGGVVQFSTKGTVYLVIRGGGNNLGTTGIAVDNVELRPIQ
jgi:SusE-like outer membrane protein